MCPQARFAQLQGQLDMAVQSIARLQAEFEDRQQQMEQTKLELAAQSEGGCRGVRDQGWRV